VSSRESTVLIADIPDHAGIEALDPGQAANLVSKFHQIVGECVYPFGGTVSDTIGSIVIAELSDPAQALEAFENLARRIETESRSTPALASRAVLNYGLVQDRDFSLTGHAVQNGLGILDSLEKNQMLVSEEVLRQVGRVPESAGFLNLGQTRFFALPLGVAGGAAAVPPVGETEEGSPELSPGSPSERSRKDPLIAVALVAILLAGLGVWLAVRNGDQKAATEPSSETVAAEPGDEAIAVAVGAITIEPGLGVPEELAERAATLLEAILDATPDVRRDAQAPNRISADLVRPETEQDGEEAAAPRAGASAGVRVIPWIETGGVRRRGEASELDDAWTVVEATLRFAGEQLRFSADRLVPRTAEVRRTFSAAVGSGRQGTPQRAQQLASALQNDADFLPGWWWIHRAELEGAGLQELRLEALRNLSRLLPEDGALARDLGQRELERGALSPALRAFARVRSSEDADGEVGGIFGLAALAAHQRALFERLVEETESPRLHPADFAVSEGRIDDGVKEYYASQPDEPENHFLSFKIGRIAVLRRSPQIAALELERLEKAGAEPMASLMRSYVAADRQDRVAAERELGPVIESPRWEDSVWFHAAEIYALLRNERRALAALERSVERGEPMMQAIPRNPLFRYLFNEPRFREIVRRLAERQREIADTLRQVT
jgi:hypothetical protein